MGGHSWEREVIWVLCTSHFLRSLHLHVEFRGQARVAQSFPPPVVAHSLLCVSVSWVVDLRGRPRAWAVLDLAQCLA